MSDFLTNLVARSAEALPPLLPRQPSPYEGDEAASEPQIFGEVGDELPIEQSPGSPRRADPPGHRAEPTSPLIDRGSPQERVLPAARALAQGSGGPLSVVPPPLPPAPRTGEVEAQRGVRADHRSKPGQDFRETVIVSPQLKSGPPPSNRPQLKSGPPPSNRPAPDALSPADQQGDLRRHERLLPVEQAARGPAEASGPRAVAASTRVLTGERSVTLPQLKPYLAPELPIALPQPSAAQPAPAVQITIGRVEVRAGPPPAHRERGAARQPAVQTLDEYLGRRRGGH